jgi:hypothetical protein
MTFNNISMNTKVIKSVVIAFLLCSVCLVNTSCSKNDDKDNTFTALFDKTDYFIGMLDTVYEHYDAFGNDAQNTSDGEFTIIPIGRLIIVKESIVAQNISYSDIETALKLHYKNESKVKNVFQNDAGTITIDCRN